MTRGKFVIGTTFGVSLGGGVVGIVTAQDNAATLFVAGFLWAITFEPHAVNIDQMEVG